MGKVMKRLASILRVPLALENVVIPEGVAKRHGKRRTDRNQTINEVLHRSFVSRLTEDELQVACRLLNLTSVRKLGYNATASECTHQNRTTPRQGLSATSHISLGEGPT